MPVLRPYQQRVIHQLDSLWSHGERRNIAVLPTGAGKSVIAAHFTQQAENPLSICHTRILAEQLNESVCRAATWQGLRKQGKWPNGTPDLIIVDEVHVGDSPDWQQVFEMIPPETNVLGLTATPWRFTHGTNADTRKKNNRYGKGLGDLFGAMIIGVTPRELVRDGYLVPIRVLNLVAAQDAEARRQNKRGPSWDGREHTGRIGAGSETRLDVFDSWQRHGEGRKTMVFCHLVPAAERACSKFIAAGIPATFVHGKLGKKECARRLADFKANRYRVMVNVMQMTAGVDVPDVSCIVIDRGCSSLNTYIQICGRGARLAEGKTDCLVLDLTGCSDEHGDPQKDQDYWVTTSEGRNVSELACDVCGTRLSPMFPTRCMRCDPFRPKLGDPQALLDTGMRVYSVIKDIGPAPTDEAIIAALDGFKAETDAEGEVLVAEVEGAKKRIQAKIDLELAKVFKAEADARAQAAKLAAEAERLKAAEEWKARLAAQAEARKAAIDAQTAGALQRNAEQTKASAGMLSGPELDTFKRALWRNVTTSMGRGWSISYAARVTRDQLDRYRGKFERENYTVPPELQYVLGLLPVKVRQYELERMLKDPKTAKYGAAWCRKKVRELFGTLDGVVNPDPVTE